MQSTLIIRMSTKCQDIEVYYTDKHDVDEDLTTIARRGGEWGQTWSDTSSGVFLCVMNFTHTFTSDGVASRYHTNRTIQTKK